MSQQKVELKDVFAKCRLFESALCSVLLYLHHKIVTHCVQALTHAARVATVEFVDTQSKVGIKIAEYGCCQSNATAVML